RGRRTGPPATACEPSTSLRVKRPIRPRPATGRRARTARSRIDGAARAGIQPRRESDRSRHALAKFGRAATVRAQGVLGDERRAATPTPSLQVPPAMTPWHRNEYMLKGVFLGLWVFVALQVAVDRDAVRVDLPWVLGWVAAGLAVGLVLGTALQLRRGLRPTQ